MTGIPGSPPDLRNAAGRLRLPPALPVRDGPVPRAVPAAGWPGRPGPGLAACWLQDGQAERAAPSWPARAGRRAAAMPGQRPRGQRPAAIAAAAANRRPDHGSRHDRTAAAPRPGAGAAARGARA